MPKYCSECKKFGVKTSNVLNLLKIHDRYSHYCAYHYVGSYATELGLSRDDAQEILREQNIELTGPMPYNEQIVLMELIQPTPKPTMTLEQYRSYWR